MLNYEFPPLGGGGGVAAKTIAKQLIAEGYEVDYVTSRYPGQRKHELIDGIQVYRVRVGRRNKNTASLHSMLAYPLAGFPQCIQLCRKNNYSVINSHFAIPTGPLGVAISKLFGINHVVSIHGGDIHDPTKEFSPHKKWYLRKIVSWVINSADSVIAQSTDTKGNALKYYDITPTQQIKVEPFPYEPYEFEPVSREELGLEDDITYTISVGRLVKRKGYRYLIDAIAMLDENIEALIVGEGPQRDELEAYAAEQDVFDRVTFLGYVSEERKFQYLDCADVYVLSSMHEGFGIVIQEAMQVGLPIVATDNGGQTDLIEQYEGGISVDTNNPSEIAAEINNQLSQPQSEYEPDFRTGFIGDYTKSLKQ